MLQDVGHWISWTEHMVTRSEKFISFIIYQIKFRMLNKLLVTNNCEEESNTESRIFQANIHNLRLIKIDCHIR